MKEKAKIEFMDGSNIAKCLGIHAATFFKFVESDKNFPVYRIGKKRKFILKEVLEYMGPHSVKKEITNMEK